MNKENIKYCIELMKYAKNLDMSQWQSPKGEIVTSIEELHRCGNTACFAGYIAISPKFQEDGGKAFKMHGGPEYRGLYAVSAIAAWLEIDEAVAVSLILGDLSLEGLNPYSYYYKKPWGDVTPEDVIEKLEGLLEVNGAK